VDTLPSLLKASGGPWDLVQSYWPGARLDTNKRGLYVLPVNDADRRHGGVRIMPRYRFRIVGWWPVKNVAGSQGAGLAETEQRNFRAAFRLVRQRVTGPVLDKTHGGRFLSVGESPSGQAPQIDWGDAEVTLPQRFLRAAMSYYADDPEFSG
jgi:hypothetical protein